MTHCARFASARCLFLAVCGAALLSAAAGLAGEGSPAAADADAQNGLLSRGRTAALMTALFYHNPPAALSPSSFGTFDGTTFSSTAPGQALESRDRGKIVDFAQSLVYEGGYYPQEIYALLGYKDAHSAEINPNTKHKVVDLMENQKNIGQLGGTMRLGGYQCKIKEGTLAYSIYGQTEITERHRHRFELNNEYLPELEKAGMIASGVNEQTDLVEIVEIPSHPFFVGVQFHPEFQSSVLKPHPLFMAFIKQLTMNNE